MNFGIKGSYTFKIPLKNGTVKLIHGNNLITFFGTSFFLNRAINEEFNTIKYIVLGNGTNTPHIMDEVLGNETIRKECVSSVDNTYKQIKLTSNFLASDLLGVTEIGVCATNTTNEPVLISHDVFSKITHEDITDSIGEIEVEYIFQLTTSSIRSGWEQKIGEYYTEYNIYYVDEPNEVISVFEENNNIGYSRVYQLEHLREHKAVFYHDTTLKKLYIRNSKNSNPNNDMIIVQNK